MLSEEAHLVEKHYSPKNQTACDQELLGTLSPRKSEPTAEYPTSETKEKLQVHETDAKTNSAVLKSQVCDSGSIKPSSAVLSSIIQNPEIPENIFTQKSDIKKQTQPRQENKHSVKRKVLPAVTVSTRGRTNKQSSCSNSKISFKDNINEKIKEKMVALQGKGDIGNESDDERTKSQLSQSTPAETSTYQPEKEVNEKLSKEMDKVCKARFTNNKYHGEEHEVDHLKSIEGKEKKPEIGKKKDKIKTQTSVLMSESDNSLNEMESNLPEDVRIKVLEVLKDAERSKNGARAFHCFYCSRVFRKRSHFIKHIDKHTKQAFDCPECGKRFKNHRNMNAHRFNRSSQKEFTCDICGHKEKTACLLRIHNKTAHPPSETFYCHLCPKVVRTKAYLNMHLKYAHGIDEGIYECPIYGHKSKRPKLFQKHLKQHQNDSNHTDRQCPICHKIFKTKLLLRSHKRVHQERKHECKQCGKKFTTVTKLAEHERTHSGDKPYQCGQCDYRSTQAGNLRNHMKVHQREQEVKKESTKSKAKPTQKKLATNETCGSVLDQTNPPQVWYDDKAYTDDQMLPVNTTTEYEGQGVVYPEQGQQIYDNELVYSNLKTGSVKDDCHQQISNEMYATPQVANQYSLDYNNMENFTNTYDTSQYYNPVEPSYMMQNDTTITNSVTAHPQHMHHMYQQTGHMSEHQNHHQQQQVQEQHQVQQQGHGQTTVSHGVMYQTPVVAETTKHEHLEHQNNLYPTQYYTDISKHSSSGNYHQDMKFNKYDHGEIYSSGKSDFSNPNNRIYLGAVPGQETLSYQYTPTPALQYRETATQQDYDIHPQSTYTELQQATATNVNQSQSRMS